MGKQGRLDLQREEKKSREKWPRLTRSRAALDLGSP